MTLSLFLSLSLLFSFFPLPLSLIYASHMLSCILSITPRSLTHCAFYPTCIPTFAQIRTYDISLTIILYSFTLLIISILLTDRDSFTARARAGNRLCRAWRNVSSLLSCRKKSFSASHSAHLSYLT